MKPARFSPAIALREQLVVEHRDAFSIAELLKMKPSCNAFLQVAQRRLLKLKQKIGRSEQYGRSVVLA